MSALDEMLARTAEPVASWPLELDLRTTGEGDSRGPGLGQAHLICSFCRQSVLCLSRDLSRAVTVVSVAAIDAAATGHYRETHTDGGGSPV